MTVRDSSTETLRPHRRVITLCNPQACRSGRATSRHELLRLQWRASPNFPHVVATLDRSLPSPTSQQLSATLRLPRRLVLLLLNRPSSPSRYPRRVLWSFRLPPSSFHLPQRRPDSSSQPQPPSSNGWGAAHQSPLRCSGRWVRWRRRLP